MDRQSGSPVRARHVVVIGGGVVGCAVAYQLRRDGLAVSLIERDGIAAHASGRSAGNLNPLHFTPPALLPVTLDAFRRHREVRAELSRLGCANAVAAPVSRLHLGAGEADRAELAETVALFNATAGFAATWLDGAALRRREPRLAADIAFGVLTEGNLSIDSGDFTRALADGAVKLGATILPAAATGLVTRGGRVVGVRVGEAVVACDALVLATGPFVAEVNDWLGIAIAVLPVKGEMLRVRLRGGASRDDLTWGSTSLYRRRSDEIWVGTTMTSEGFDDAPTAGAKALLLARAARIMPDIVGADVLDHVAALRPVATPNAPIAGRAAGWENVFVANGGGAKGVLLSVGIAARISEQMLLVG